MMSPGLGGVGQLAVLREEQDRRVHRDRLAEPDGVSFMPRLKVPETMPHEGDAVAVLRVHVGLDLEHEAGDLVARRARPARRSRGCGRGGGA